MREEIYFAAALPKHPNIVEFIGEVYMRNPYAARNPSCPQYVLAGCLQERMAMSASDFSWYVSGWHCGHRVYVSYVCTCVGGWWATFLA